MLAVARRVAAARLLAQLEPSSVAALQRQPGQQAAGYAKKDERADNRVQNVLKMLEPRQVEEIELSKEDYEEGMRRCEAGRPPQAAERPSLLLLSMNDRWMTAGLRGSQHDNQHHHHRQQQQQRQPS